MITSLKRAGASLLLGCTALCGAGAANAATVNFLDLGNRLVSVNSTAPGTIVNTVVLTGIQGNETLLGIDYRPASSRVLYGLSNAGRLYAINPLNGSATAVGAPVTLNGVAAGVDFNPSVDRIRVVTNTNQNLRLNPDTGGLAATDTPLAYAATDAGAGSAPRVAGAAYTNNVPGGTPTTLYVIDTNRGVLATQGSVGSTPVSPNSGQLFTVGSLGVATNDNVGFDIARDGTVLASLTQPGTGTTSLYSVDLTTGKATLIGVVGAGGKTYLGLAIAAPTIASYGTTANQIAVGTAIDNFTGVPSAGLNSLFNSLDGLPAGDRAAALSQLTPSAYSLLPEVTLRTAEFEQATLQRYLRDFRDHGTGGLAGSDGKIGSFIVGTARYGKYDPAVDRAAVDYTGAGVMAGIDLRLADAFLVGVTAGYDNAQVKFGASQDSEIKNYFGGAYATFGFGPAFIDLFGTYGEADYDLRRSVNFGSNAATGGFSTALDFAAKTHSKTYLGGGNIGVSLKFGGLVLEPFAGARYARVNIDGFNDGSGLGGLTLGNVRYESVLGNFGAKLGAEVAVGGVVVRPEVRGAYRHEFRKDGQNGFNYGFGGIGNTSSLPFTPSPLRRNYYTGGAGFTVSSDRSPISLVVDYNGEYSKDRTINGITGGLRLVF